MRAPVTVLFVVLAAIACLSPAQNDTWWHLRAGQEMVRSHHLLFEDRFSSTVPGTFFWNHSWLSQVIFYATYRIGGLPALTALCASAVVGAWALTWRLMRGAFVDRLILVAAAVSSATVTWSLRPQAFSIFLLAVVLWLVASDRWRVLPVVFVAWANLHAGFVLGLVVVGAGVLTAAVWDRGQFVRRAAWAAVATAATLVTPLGIRNWSEIVASMGRSRANVIQEWTPPALPPEHIAFWGLAALLLIVAATRWRQADTQADRTLLVAALVVLPLAVRSLRNVPAFTMLVLPATSRLMLRDVPASDGSGDVSRHGWWAAAISVSAGIAVVGVAWAKPWPMLGWRPVSAAAASAIASCAPPLYNTYEGGGPLIWFVPSQRVFVDSRQDPFPVALVQEASEVERSGAYRALFERWGINCAALPPASPAARRLSADGWTTRFEDRQWIVLERPRPAPRAATASPAP